MQILNASIFKSRKKLSYTAVPQVNSSSGEGPFRMSASSRDGGDEYSSEASELDTLGTVGV